MYRHDSRSGFLAFVIVLVGLAACIPTAVADYVPPIGIPAPSFGINELHTMYAGQWYTAGGFTYRDAGNGPYTHYVDNAHPSATNSGNPYGTATTPRLDIFNGSSITLPAGSVVEIHGGPYSYSGSRSIFSQGTASNPVFVRSVDPVGKVRVQGTSSHDFRLAGSYMILENMEYYNRAWVRVVSGAHHICMRSCEIHDPVGQWLAGGSAFYAGSFTNDIVAYRNHIHDKLKGSPASPGDCHGVNIGSGTQNVWVLENNIHDNSGDAFQAAHQASPAPHHVYVGANELHDDRENGVDLKTIHDVVVSQNVIYGYQASATSIGDAIVIGSNGFTPGSYGPIRSWILFNDIRNSQTGIRVEGAVDCWIIGNRIHDTNGNGVQFDIDPDSSNINVVGNTIVSIGGDGVHHSWNVGATEFHIEDNIFSNIAGDDIQLDQPIAQQADLRNNLFWAGGGNISIKWGSTTYVGTSASGINSLPDSSGNVVGDPMFVNQGAKNYRIQFGSAAKDVGFESAAYLAFQTLYGLDIRVDSDALSRPQESGWDIGAYEYFNPVNVVGRHVFYNNSYYDGNNPAASASDDAAIATDKIALLPEQVAMFANYTSYSRGVNGVMVDIENLPATPTAGDFAFKVGNDNIPSGWPSAPAPTSVTVRAGAGAGGSDRVTVVWADGAVQKQWLQVTVLATANTGLSSPEVFYLGNAIGETGNSPSDAEVTPADEVGVRNNPHTLGGTPAAIDDAYDFNRDRKVGPTDQIICRNNGTSSPTALKLIVLVTNQAPTADAGPDDAIILPTNMASLDGTVSDDGYPLPTTLTTTWTKISGPGGVIFGNSSAVDTNATFLAAGPYVLQLEASDGELSGTDTVEIDVIDPTGLFFDDDFDDNNLNGWTALAGSFATFQYPSDPAYEVHATAADSRMRADLTDTNLSDIVYISCELRHTAGTAGSSSGMGWKPGRLWLVDDSGAGFCLYFALDQNGAGGLYIYTTTDFGATETWLGDFLDPGDPNGNDKKTVELVYNRLTDQVECFYEGASKGTLSVSSSYRDFTKLVVYLKHAYAGGWGQLDIDDVRIANTSAGG